MSSATQTHTSIREIVQNSQREVFSARGLRIEFLKDCPQAVSTVAEWIYSEWRPYDSTLTLDKLKEGYAKRLNDEQMPFTLVVWRGNRPIATVSLKASGEPEFAKLASDGLWLSSLQIVIGERKKGLGKALVHLIKEIALNLGHTYFYLYTSNPKNVDWYRRHGGTLLGLLPFHNHKVSLIRVTI